MASSLLGPVSQGNQGQFILLSLSTDCVSFKYYSDQLITSQCFINSTLTAQAAMPLFTISADDSGGEGLLQSFLGALQASLAVLLTISYGVGAAQWDLLDHHAAKKINTVAVKIFLPALLITKLGSELHVDTGARYVPILLWSLFYTLVSMAIGMAAVAWLKMPTWVTPAICFNNTTSLPLLLVEALQSTGLLDQLLKGNDSVSDAVKRAESYFLVCAVVGNCLTFAIGPRLLDAEFVPDDADRNAKSQVEEQNGHLQNGDVEQGNQQEEENEGDNNGGDDNPTEHTSLLPSNVLNAQRTVSNKISPPARSMWDKLSPKTQKVLSLAGEFLNAPLLGAILGGIIGLTPPLHRAFFSDSQNGGVLNAWLTKSIQNVGDLFASLQAVAVGVNLSTALRKAKRGDSSGKVPWTPMLFVLFMRFIFWPLISIPFIYGLAAKTNVLDDDPILWFAMMLCACGPSSLKISAMADVSGADEEEMNSISKFLTVCLLPRAIHGSCCPLSILSTKYFLHCSPNCGPVLTCYVP